MSSSAVGKTKQQLLHASSFDRLRPLRLARTADTFLRLCLQLWFSNCFFTRNERPQS